MWDDANAIIGTPLVSGSYNKMLLTNIIEYNDMII